MGGKAKSQKPKQQVTEYRLSEHFGICLTGLDYMSEIKVGDKVAWHGKVSDVADIPINKPSLFGGIRKEGGVAGSAYFLPGKEDQLMPTRICAKYGLSQTEMPAYRGKATVYFLEPEGSSRKGFYWAANTPYLRDVKIRVAAASYGLEDEYARIYRGTEGAISFYFLLDRSQSLSPTEFNTIKNAVLAALDIIEERLADADHIRTDVGVRFYSTGSTAIERTRCTVSDIDDIRTFIAGVGRVFGGDVDSAMEFVEDWFLATVPTSQGGTGTALDNALGIVNSSGATQGFDKRVLVFVTDSETEDSMTAASTGPAADMLNRSSGVFAEAIGTAVDMHAINYNTSVTTWTGLLDNTPQDGVPIIDGSNQDGLTAAVRLAIAGKEFDSNAMHIIYECLTNVEWGMGGAPGSIDKAAFEAAAVTLYAEGFGISMLWAEQASIEEIVNEVIDHIEAYLFISPITGLLTPKLIRNDYNVEDLPVFDETNSTVLSFKRKLFGETINEIVVEWTDPRNEKIRTVTVQDTANIAIQGRVVSDKRSYHGIRKADLATEVAWRDLRVASSPIATCELEIDRSAWNLTPGQTCVVVSPEDDIDTIVMRVGPVDYGTMKSSKIKVSLAEDVFALDKADYVEPGDVVIENPDEPPLDMAYSHAFTVPYYLAINNLPPVMLAAGFEYPDVFACILGAQTGEDTPEFDVWGELTNAAGGTYSDLLGTLTTVARTELATALPQEATSVISDSLTYTQGEEAAVGDFVYFQGADETEDEIALVTDLTGGLNLDRGVLDTTPKVWPVGTPMWVLTAEARVVETTVRSDAEAITYQLLPITSSGTLDPALASDLNVTMSGRPHLPTRPANVKVDGTSFGLVDCTGTDPFDVTWNNRNRLEEDSLVLGWTDADVPGETNQYTRVTIRNPVTGAVVTTYDDVSGNTQSVPHTAFSGLPRAIVKVESKVGSDISLQGHEIEVKIAELTMDSSLYTMDSDIGTADEA